MEKLQEKLNNLDNIIGHIEKNDSLQKKSLGNNLKTIGQMDKQNKLDLDSKLDTINKFSDLLENIISNKPEPESLDSKLVKYIGYDNYYEKLKFNLNTK
jgi:hypothetical protein